MGEGVASLGPLCAGLAVVCGEVAGRLVGGAAGEVAAVRRRLGQPLRVAVAGRLKAGKSTLVNALVGRVVVPTAVGECTRVVTRLRYGWPERVEVVCRDGRRLPLGLDGDGMVPRRLGVAVGEVAWVDVWVGCEPLRRLTVVDTPGLSSAGGVAAADGPAGVDEGSWGALLAAEAVVYVFTQAVRGDDVAVLEQLRSSAARLSSGPLNSLGLLNKVDVLCGGGDPWVAAGALAAGQAGVLRRLVGEVVPVVGLLAQTGWAGGFGEVEAAAVAEVAVLPRGVLDVLLASVDLFVSLPCGVDEGVRRRLVELLGLYGVGVVVRLARERPGVSCGEMVEALRAASGFVGVRDGVERVLRARGDVIKASWVLGRLDRVAAHADQATDREVLRAAVEGVLADPAFHVLRVLDAAQRVGAGVVRLPQRMEVELRRLALSSDPGWVLGMVGAPAPAVRAAAVEAAGRWRAFAVSAATPAQARVAQVGQRGFHLLAAGVGR